MELLKYITIILTAIIGVFAVMKDYRKRKSKMLNKSGIILISLIIISSMTALLFDRISLRESKRNEKELKLSITNLEKDNYELSRKLTETTLELNKNIIGDGYALFGLFGQNETKFYGSLKSNSRYNIYDISSLVSTKN